MVKTKKILTVIVVWLFLGITLAPNITSISIDSCFPSSDFNFLNKDTKEYWAVIVEITEYQDRSLNRIHGDIYSLYNALKSSKNWKENHIKLLINQNATKKTILDALDWLANKSSSDDVVMFAYYGHGGIAHDKLAIIPYDYDKKTELAVDVDELNQKFNNISYKGMLLIFACCLSGSFIEPLSHLNDNVTTHMIHCQQFVTKFKENLEKSNRIIITSSLPNSDCYYLPCLVSIIGRGLKGKADKDHNGIVSAEEAFYYAKPRNLMTLAIIWGTFYGILPSVILKQRILSLRTFARPILAFTTANIYFYLLHRTWILPFLQIYDGYEGELPITYM